MARAVLWDLDGTLVDSAELHWLSWRDTMAAEGITITYQQFRDSFGQKNDRILPGWLGPGADAERIRRIGDAKEAEYRRLAGVHGLTPLPGAASWVRRLHSQRWQQAIASSAPRENVGVMLRALALDGMFEAIVSAEDVSRGKPDPQVFLAAAVRLGIPPHRCVVVEDAAVGVAAARSAEMKCVGVNPEVVLDADVAVSSLLELPADAFDRLVETR
jgi:HAD superfamily hydrolase (TIGR01509 family)